MGVTAVAVEMIIRRLSGLTIKVVGTAIDLITGRLAIEGLEKVGMEMTEMLMFADLGPVGWVIDAAMAMGMLMSFGLHLICQMHYLIGLLFYHKEII